MGKFFESYVISFKVYGRNLDGGFLYKVNSIEKCFWGLMSLEKSKTVISYERDVEFLEDILNWKIKNKV